MHTIETLEGRRLLAAWVTGSGTLVVLGTDGPDEIRVGRTLRSTAIEAGVTINGEYTPIGDELANVRRVYVDAGAGDDVIGGNGLFVRGTTILGGGGNDVIDVWQSGTVADGGAGDDQIEATWQDATLYGGRGNDRLTGGSGAQLLHDGPGEDVVFGGDGPDTIHAGDAPDAADYYSGGTGRDTLTFADRRWGVNTGASVGGGGFDAQTGEPVDTDRGGGVIGEGDRYAGDFAVIVGSEHDDVLLAVNDGGTVLFGLGGNDRLIGGAGPDTLDAGPGDDHLVGGYGVTDEAAPSFRGGFRADASDVLHGGEGRDTVSYRERSRAVTVTLDGLANDGADGEGDWVVAVEDVNGGYGDDLLIGDDADNELVGGGGGDSLLGGGGNDALYADASTGVERILLDGGDGNDLLDSSSGDVTVRGGTKVTMSGKLVTEVGLGLGLSVPEKMAV